MDCRKRLTFVLCKFSSMVKACRLLCKTQLTLIAKPNEDNSSKMKETQQQLCVHVCVHICKYKYMCICTRVNINTKIQSKILTNQIQEPCS